MSRIHACSCSSIERKRLTGDLKFPFETGETVWIVKPEYRAPLGEFQILKAHPNDKFELLKISDNTIHHEHVDGKFLRRDPFMPSS